MKRFSAAVLALSIIAGMCFSSYAFEDVYKDDWYYDVVEQAEQNGLMGGISSSEFGPNSYLTRGMFVTILGRTLDIQTEGSATFTDVNPRQYYAPYIAWASDNQIAGGVGNGLFAPERPITREEMAAMLLNTYNYLGDGPQGNWMVHLDYSDADQISKWAVSGVAYCKVKGILEGFDGVFRPKDYVTRAEAAAVAVRLFNGGLDQQYAAAVEDAETIEPEEILPVVAITQDSDMVTWNQTEDKVLLLSMHNYPDSYIPGERVNLEWGEVWTFTDKEIQVWYDKNHEDVVNWDLRLAQLIGLPKDNGYTHVTGMWVSPEDILRPAYVSDITQSEMTDTFSGQEDQEYLDWFEGNAIWSYEESAYPWTRLGYTYDWAGEGTEYGLSEFLVLQGSDVDVEFTCTIQEFVEKLDAGDFRMLQVDEGLVA